MPPSRARTRWSAAKWIAAILAITVHVAFLLFLIFSVNWQNPKPEPVTAELYVPPPEKIGPAKPPPEPPKPEPEPPKPPIEPPKPPPPADTPKPNIALKERQERLKKPQAER